MTEDDNVTSIWKNKVVAEVGGRVDRTSATVALYGDELDPDELTATLGCLPSHAHRRGDRKPHNPPWETGAWLVTMEGEPDQDPESLLVSLLERLPQEADTWRGLSRRFRISVGIGLFLSDWNRGFELSSDFLRRVLLTGASLDFDIYANGLG